MMSLRPLLLCASVLSLVACTSLRQSARVEGPASPAPASGKAAPGQAGGAGAAAAPEGPATPAEATSSAAPAGEEALAAQQEAELRRAEQAAALARAREAVVKRARARLGRRGMPGGLRDDCAGLVRHAYRAIDVELMPREGKPGENAVTAIHREAERRAALEAPGGLQPGDLVFFRETYDRNRDGRRNDGLTHVGVVEAVGEDGTVVFIHRGMKGVARSHFNTARPDVHAAGGRVLNAWLRTRSKRLRAYLAGELYAGYASLARMVDGTMPPAEAPAAVASCPVPGCRVR